MFWISLLAISACQIDVDCGKHCYDKWGDSSPNKIKEVVDKAVYPFVQEGVQFSMGEIRIHPHLTFPINKHKHLKTYSGWLVNNSKTGCINLLMDRLNTNSNVGRAYVGTVCRGLNVGLVAINTDYNKMIATTAHEIGHILGLSHTCSKSNSHPDSCFKLEGNKCNPFRNKYLMYPLVDVCYSNNMKLSPCSVSQLKKINLPCQVEVNQTKLLGQNKPNLKCRNEIIISVAGGIWIALLLMTNVIIYTT